MTIEIEISTFTQVVSLILTLLGGVGIGIIIGALIERKYG